MEIHLLNGKQKQYLFDTGLVTAKVLDADTSEDWQTYFKTKFDWWYKIEKGNWNSIRLARLTDDYSTDYQFFIHPTSAQSRKLNQLKED